MKYLYANGCSWTCDGPKPWPSFLGEKLSVEVINDSKGGGSNDRIFRTTTNFLVENQDILNELIVVIGFTWPTRLEYLEYTEDGPKYKNVTWENEKALWPYYLWNESTIDSNHPRDPYFKKLSKNIIINLHKHLLELDIPHLFFFIPYDIRSSSTWSEKELNYLNMQNFIFDVCFEELKIDQVSDKDTHPGIKSHEKMANYIYEIIK